jgi:uroporphyrinogen-III decarboxylase
MITGTDFGSQNGPLTSPKIYREVFFPFHKRMCDWVHENTSWRTFIHSCGSVVDFIPDFIKAGFEIINPVQTSCAGMDPQELKRRFGRELTFWGGGIDTQKTLPFGSPDEVREEVLERLRIFGPGGGYVFNPIHNVQAGVPIENLLAMYEAFQEYSRYPLRRGA